jgi:hypothetical protein
MVTSLVYLVIVSQTGGPDGTVGTVMAVLYYLAIGLLVLLSLPFAIFLLIGLLNARDRANASSRGPAKVGATAERRWSGLTDSSTGSGGTSG